MKTLLTMLLVLWAIPCFAITADEVVTQDDVTISITFTTAEYGFFSLDKGDPKEWIRNSCYSNNSRRKERMMDAIKKDIVVTEEDILAEVKKIKKEKDAH